MKFLKVVLASGETVISEFAKLVKVQRYVTQVIAGARPMNIWRVVGTTHPASGESCLMRSREMIHGSQVRSVVEVEPTTHDHGYDVANFRPVAVPQNGEAGNWMAPAAPPEGAVAGVRYPVHRNPTTHRRFVVLRAASGDAGPLVHWLDPEGVSQAIDMDDAPADADDDMGDDSF